MSATPSVCQTKQMWTQSSYVAVVFWGPSSSPRGLLPLPPLFCLLSKPMALRRRGISSPSACWNKNFIQPSLAGSSHEVTVKAKSASCKSYILGQSQLIQNRKTRLLNKTWGILGLVEMLQGETFQSSYEEITSRCSWMSTPPSCKGEHISRKGKSHLCSSSITVQLGELFYGAHVSH